MRLQLRLQRLQAMREAGARLIGRDRLGRDVFRRGAPEGLKVVRQRRLAGRSLRPHLRLRHRPRADRALVHIVARRPVMTLDEAHPPARADDRRAARMDRARGLPARDPGRRVPQVGARLELRRDARAGAAGQGRSCGRRTPSRAALREGGMKRAFGRRPARGRGDAVRRRGADERRRDRALCRRGRRRARRRWPSSQADYAGRGVELVERGGRWHFQTARRPRPHPPARARGEPRGSAARRSRRWRSSPITSRSAAPRSRRSAACRSRKGTLDVLMEAGWVRPAGRREVPGRPLTYATTQDFLTHFGLESRRDLPGSTI